ncbi:MAG: hypothetical protein GY754_26295 [bacterium]|nr:hypothetical protein [bacterium]
MKKIILFLITVSLFSLLSSCAGFIPEEADPVLRNYETKIYVMQNEVKIKNRILKAGQRVKIHIVPGDEWIKVYAFPEAGELLKSKRTLILYMFTDEFPEEIFDMKIFEDRLLTVVKPG